MSRLTNSTYLHQHNELRRLWLDDPVAFGYLSPDDQWRLHRFYQPDKDMSPDALLAHRQTVTEAEPSLPQQAGPALNLLYERASSPVVNRNRHARHVSQRSQGTHHITVRAVVRPEPDVKRLVSAVLDLARQLQRDPELMAWAEENYRRNHPRGGMEQEVDDD